MGSFKVYLDLYLHGILGECCIGNESILFLGLSGYLTMWCHFLCPWSILFSPFTYTYILTRVNASFSSIIAFINQVVGRVSDCFTAVYFSPWLLDSDDMVAFWIKFWKKTLLEFDFALIYIVLYNCLSIGVSREGISICGARLEFGAIMVFSKRFWVAWRVLINWFADNVERGFSTKRKLG